MILVGHYDSPYVRRVAISLMVLGMAFERRLLSVFGDAETMRRINPLGRVPALALDDGEVLIDSAAILDHLDERAGGECALMPMTGKARRDALRLLALATGCSDKAIAIAYEQRRPQPRVDPAWLARCGEQLESGLAALQEAALPEGERLTQPAITIATMLGYVRLRVPHALAPGRFPQLDRLAARCEAHPAFKACLPGLKEIGGAEPEAALARLRRP